MDDKKIKLGLPKGSLNTVGRGNTYQILVDAGYEIKGYEPGKESDDNLLIKNDDEIEPFLCRPQSAPVDLSFQFLDIAIVGEDWVREETVNDKNCNGIVKRIGDLEYGDTRMVFDVRGKDSYESLSDFFRALKGREKPILCFTEYVNLTRDWIMRNEAYQEIFGNKTPLVRFRAFVGGENGLVRVIYSDGVTEGYIAKGADIIVDNTQTGNTLRKYKLRELEKIMDSSAGLYAGPSCTGWKEDKANGIFKMLKGVIEARKRFDVKFDVPNDQLERTRKYLIEQGLCSDEPTITRMQSYSAVNVLIPSNRYPEVRDTLQRDFKASAIVRNEVKQYVP